MLGTYRPEAYKKTVTDVIELMLRHMDEECQAGAISSGTLRATRGLCLNYIVVDTARFDKPGKKYYKDRLLPWSEKRSIGDRRLFDLQPPEIMEFRRAFKAAGASFMLRMRLLGTLRRIFDFAITELGWAYTNPTDGMVEKRHKDEMVGRIEIFQKPHIRLFMKVGSELQGLLVQFTSSTAMRVGEVMAVRWENILWEKNKIDVAWAVEETGRIGRPKTAAGMRQIDMSAQLKKMLEDRFAQLSEANGHVPPDDSDFVFEYKGSHFTHNRFYEHVVWPLFDAARRYLVENPGEFPELPKQMSWKDFRHFGISTWLECGFEDVAVWTMAGHANFSSIEQTYGHVFDSQRRVAILTQLHADVFDEVS